MSDLNSAAMMLGGISLAWAAIVFAIWWFRRPRPDVPAYEAPKAPRAPGESRFSKLPRPSLSRSAASKVEEIEMSPSRLARISAKSMADQWNNAAPAYDPDPEVRVEAEPEAAVVAEDLAVAEPAAAPFVAETPATEYPFAEPAAENRAIDEATLESLASEVEHLAHAAPHPASDRVIARLVPQIPPRDAIFRTSWLGGRPHLPTGMPWPQIDGNDGDFLAQLNCADLPPALWEGLGPRTSSLAFFSNPDTGAIVALHLHEDGPPRDAPRAVGAAYFHPYGVDSADLMPHAIRAFPEWPIDIVAVAPDGADPRNAATEDAAALLAADYDIADPAFHPFDWPSMLALADILESRLKQQPVDGGAPDDASDELAQTIADAATSNREAIERADEILSIIREGAGQGVGFSPPDATAVMAGLHAIRWTRVWTVADEESGEDQVETITLPLTRHRPDGDLWVDDYRTILFDHAKHAWCRHPETLSAPARAFFEPLCATMAAPEMPALGNFPTNHAIGFDDERDAVMLEFPAGGLMSRGARGGGDLVFAIRKADLAVGDFSKMRALHGT
ncbi:MAG: DUF1963 domain-containing protein [Sphingomonadales bacterium]|nr:DUF1963 domain-containing protein [Sphingomonadales bacterium]